MLVESMGSAIVISKAQGGRLKNLLDITIEKWWVFFLAGLLEFVATYVRANEIEPLWTWVDQRVMLIQFISYTLLMIGLYYNRNRKGFYFIFVGILLNLIVIGANGGRMPVDVRGFDPNIYKESLEALISGKDLTHEVINESTKLWFLGDIIHLKKPYPLPKSISIGDVIMMIGIFLFTRQELMKRNTMKI